MTGVGVGTGLAFTKVLHTKLHLPADALKRATPGPMIAFGAIAAASAITDRVGGMYVSDKPAGQYVQQGLTGAGIFAALTASNPMFHGTKQALPVSIAVNAVLGAALAVSFHALDRHVVQANAHE